MYKYIEVDVEIFSDKGISLGENGMPKVVMVMIVIFYEMFICCLILCCENVYEFASGTVPCLLQFGCEGSEICSFRGIICLRTI